MSKLESAIIECPNCMDGAIWCPSCCRCVDDDPLCWICGGKGHNTCWVCDGRGELSNEEYEVVKDCTVTENYITFVMPAEKEQG